MEDVQGEATLSKNGFFETFWTLPETFFRLLGPEGPRTFSRLFSDFWDFGPETPPPRPGRSQDKSFSESFSSHFS